MVYKNTVGSDGNIRSRRVISNLSSFGKEGLNMKEVRKFWCAEHNSTHFSEQIDWTDEIAGELQSVLTKISKLERNISYRYGELIHDIESQYHDWLTKQKGTQNA